MQSSNSTVDEAPAPTLTDGVEAWSTLCAKLAQRARLDAEIVELTGRVQRSGTIEVTEGVTLDTALTLVHRLPAGERGMMVTASEVLADMPATMRFMKDRTLSWGQVRGIVAEAKRLTKEDRLQLDRHIEASQDRLTKMDPDDAVDAARVVVEELRGRRQAERREEREARANFVWGQPAMFGPGKIYGEMDNLSLASVLARMDAMAPPDDGRSLSQRRADGLVAMARHQCDDQKAAPATAVNVVVPLDVDSVDVTAAGTIEINAPGCLPTITARAAEALAADASVQVVLFDGGRPLTVTKKVWAKTMPAAVRTAVKIRDRGDGVPELTRPHRARSPLRQGRCRPPRRPPDRVRRAKPQTGPPLRMEGEARPSHRRGDIHPGRTHLGHPAAGHAAATTAAG